MARNQVHDHGDSLTLPVAAGTVSGNAVAVRQIPGVALTSRDANGDATVRMKGVFNLAAVGQEWNGTAIVNVAIAPGNILYLNGTTLNRDNRGVRFGYALDAVAAGATATIRVKVGY